MLQVPSMGEIHSQDPSDFTIVVEFDAVVTDNLALERPDEDLILDMYVFVPRCILARRISAVGKLFTKGSAQLPDRSQAPLKLSQYTCWSSGKERVFYGV